MLVKSRMRKQVHMVHPEASIEEARGELRRNRIHHLPVVKDERLVGIVSDRDLRAPASGAKTVDDVMTANPTVVSPAVPVDEAARIMRKKQINSLPVVDIGKVVGIHIDERVLTDGKIDINKTQPIARCGYYEYIMASDPFSMIIPGDPATLYGLEGSVRHHKEHREREAANKLGVAQSGPP